MKYKRKILIIIGILCLLVCVFLIWAFSMTKWTEVLETYGPLNVIDETENIEKNQTAAYYTVSGGKEMKVAGNVVVAEGNTDILIDCESIILVKETYKRGNYEFSSDVLKIIEASDITICCNSSDDVEGTYSIRIYTRERNINHLINVIKENFD